MRVAVVCNHDHTGVINRFGQPRPEAYGRETFDNVAAALQEGGHETLLCEGDKGLLATLERFLPPDPLAQPSGMVFNMAYGIQGECYYAHVPAMLEMAGVPYTGSPPLGLGLAQDKVLSKIAIRSSGVPTPNFRVMRRGTESTGDLRFPVIVKPRHEDNSFGLQLIHEPAQLRQAVEVIVTQYAQDALVEEYIDGREICVALLGNGEFEVFPSVEIELGDAGIWTWEAKYVAASARPQICPAQIESGLETVLRDISIAAFLACQCRDYARVDLRIDRSGRPFVLEINPLPSLGMRSSYTTAAITAGHSYSSLVNRILDVAHTRAFGIGVL
ncbi:MAG: ATP-grasp domain-containing protein [Mesorhizobium sp.]|uniref:D-alanine--D-alanine ligase family protein n=1 Tax=Mesorhizobium sp. TaxID=1871066 RepID=UPI000FE2F041|nr:ATP-grasp domain-containing protein [Mesorhizobium sp.]RWG77320.1 MAG: ATP-grasp domain-containing protein [Mesorhizobium sp.]RWI42123.1 MAG: ATP-grasp domain-containing protein [Mesorhizobium sp.]RWJ27828.1 MAG: ATP-grasp domain-containing protein [Mesorhizobium sp.]RWJ83835.1 MAG: ATP-grasp domain-containing protein [Mesorhizobium sp.]RWK13521.1 MAG: ATP-grasp domain-containing protein [Mesorhizobium sp.]